MDLTSNNLWGLCSAYSHFSRRDHSDPDYRHYWKHNYFFLPTKNSIPIVNAEETQKIKYNYLYSKRQRQTLLIDPV